MNIIINTSSLLKSSEYGQEKFFNQCIFNIIDSHQEHSFFLITDSSPHQDYSRSNAVILAMAPKAKKFILRIIWYGFKLPKLLKKYKAELFINIDPICLLKANLPQCIVVNNGRVFSYPAFFKNRYKAYLNKATMAITFSQSGKNLISSQYKIAAEKLSVIYNGVDEKYIPATEIERESLKEIYAQGKEYFLFTAEISASNNLTRLLKAFSFFKKRQKSNMQLIIATSSILTDTVFIESLKTYKFKEDVKLMFDLQEEELTRLTAGAYAFLYATIQNDYYAPVLQAMQCGVPVITSDTAIMKEVCGDAALFTDPLVFESIAGKMMLLFKDENKRNELIASGRRQVEQYSLRAATGLLWQTIIKCTPQQN